MKYRFMEDNREVFRVKKMSKVLKVSRGSYYAWRKHVPSKRQKANEWLLERVREAYIKSRKIYGSPRIKDVLNDQGIVCGKNRVARIMQDNGIRAMIRKKFKRTTDSGHRYPVSENLLIHGSTRERIWASDITFIPTREGLIHHSDRGKQYASYEYQDLLERHGIKSSMSRSGNCYDNAYIESFWGTLKKELVYGQRYQTREEARLSIFEYVEVFYNRIRKHSALGYKSPEQYGELL